MAGGIQKGTMAWDADSMKLDKQVSQAAKELSEDKDIIELGLKYQRKLTKEQIPGGSGACCPDGGVWFLDGVLIAAFEAKKQGDAGNAIERWYKNLFLLNKINKSISYVTFATGAGAVPKGPIGVTLSAALLNEENIPEFDTLRLCDVSVFMEKDGFTQSEITSMMKRALIETAKEYCK